MKYENVFSLLEDITINNGEKISLGMKSKWGWNEFTYKGLGLLSRRLASYLINNLKIEKCEKLAILSESKPEYGACVFGSVLAGLTTVPLDNKLTIYELVSILSDCAPKVILASANNIEKAKELKDKIPSLEYIILMDSSPYLKTTTQNGEDVHLVQQLLLFIHQGQQEILRGLKLHLKICLLKCTI